MPLQQVRFWPDHLLPRGARPVYSMCKKVWLREQASFYNPTVRLETIHSLFLHDNYRRSIYIHIANDCACAKFVMDGLLQKCRRCPCSSYNIESRKTKETRSEEKEDSSSKDCQNNENKKTELAHSKKTKETQSKENDDTSSKDCQKNQSKKTH